MAVVVAIAVYESPEIRRLADDLRRRIAVAMQTLSDNINPDDTAERQRREQQQDEDPVFNRPEDAEGFLLSRGGRASGDPGVVADEESRRRQREELMYWNRVRLEQQQKKEEEQRRQQQLQTSRAQPSAPQAESWQPREALEAMQRATREAAAAAGIYLPALLGNGGGSSSSSSGPQAPPQPRSKTSFDEFMRPDENGDRSTFVMNTGADVSHHEADDNSGLLRRRRPEGVRGPNAAVYANPFGDEYGIDSEDYMTTTSSLVNVHAPAASEAFNSETAYRIAPGRDDVMSDIYSATEPDTAAHSNNATANATAVASANAMDAVFDPLPIIPESRSVHSFSDAPASEVFFDVNDYASPETVNRSRVHDTASELSLRLERALADNDGYMTAGQDDRRLMADDDGEVNTEAYNSIQAWAQSSSAPGGFYSPLPVTPSVAMSEPSVISAGELTPTGSLSTWGDDDHSVIDRAEAGEEQQPQQPQQPPAAAQVSSVLAPPPAPSPAAASPLGSTTAAAGGSDYGVVSDDDGESVMTPTSWSEVGSVVSESDAGLHAA